MGVKRVCKECNKEVIFIAGPTKERPISPHQYWCSECDRRKNLLSLDGSEPKRKTYILEDATKLIQDNGATYNERIEMMRKEKEEEEGITLMEKIKPRIRGEII